MDGLVLNSSTISKPVASFVTGFFSIWTTIYFMRETIILLQSPHSFVYSALFFFGKIFILMSFVGGFILTRINFHLIYKHFSVYMLIVTMFYECHGQLFYPNYWLVFAILLPIYPLVFSIDPKKFRLILVLNAVLFLMSYLATRVKFIEQGYFSTTLSFDIFMTIFACTVIAYLCGVIVNRESRKRQTEIVAYSKMAALGKLSAGIAHEINNPIAIIKMLLENFEYDPTISNTTMDSILKISQNVDRIALIVKGFRSFSRTEKTFASKVLININVVLVDILNLLIPQTSREGITVITDLGFEENLSNFMGIPGKLEQVITNLMSNAIDAIGPKKDRTGSGTINITTAFYKETKEAIITVQDNGPGIPDEIVSQIFDPFFTTKEQGKGTGLGLSISKGIVEDLGGTIKYEYADPGARFTIKFKL